MTAFGKLRTGFPVNWTTLFIGWRGLGPLSPWPDQWAEFPPLLSTDELRAYAEERLASSSNEPERAVILRLLSELDDGGRQAITSILSELTRVDGGNQDTELRKWRLILLEDVLDNMPTDAVYGLTALTEFWQSFGFPSESPHLVQGRGNTVTPSEYYQQVTLDRLRARHRAWIEEERAAL